MSGHDGSMERVGEEIASRNSASADRRPTAHALALLPTIRTLMAAGFISQRALAKELNRRRIPTTLAGKWHRTTVTRVLARLGLITNGRTNIGRSQARAADLRAKALASTIRKLRKAGFVSASAIARELNAREIPTTRGSKWPPTTVKRLLQRLERLDRVSHSQHPR